MQLAEHLHKFGDSIFGMEKEYIQGLLSITRTDHCSQSEVMLQQKTIVHFYKLCNCLAE